MLWDGLWHLMVSGEGCFTRLLASFCTDVLPFPLTAHATHLSWLPSAGGRHYANVTVLGLPKEVVSKICCGPMQNSGTLKGPATTLRLHSWAGPAAATWSQ